jgi:protein-S-isoprenylcysteine O-methyltransferase Ste14
VTVPVIATLVRVLWVAAEYLHQRRHPVRPAQDWDRKSAVLWDAANVVEPAGMILGFVGVGQMRAGGGLVGWFGLALLVAGVAVRRHAVRTLGKFFTGTVVIRDDHRLVRAGLYRHVRHPAYAGALLAHLGLGLSFSNWFTLAFSVVPYSVAAAYRIRIEERALREAFGEDYADYARRTKRLIPGVY